LAWPANLISVCVPKVLLSCATASEDVHSCGIAFDAMRELVDPSNQSDQSAKRMMSLDASSTSTRLGLVSSFVWSLRKLIGLDKRYVRIVNH
jgi:hypothetical protein